MGYISTDNIVSRTSTSMRPSCTLLVWHSKRLENGPADGDNHRCIWFLLWEARKVYAQTPRRRNRQRRGVTMGRRSDRRTCAVRLRNAPARCGTVVWWLRYVPPVHVFVYAMQLANVHTFVEFRMCGQTHAEKKPSAPRNCTMVRLRRAAASTMCSTATSTCWRLVLNKLQQSDGMCSVFLPCVVDVVNVNHICLYMAPHVLGITVAHTVHIYIYTFKHRNVFCHNYYTTTTYNVCA